MELEKFAGSSVEDEVLAVVLLLKRISGAELVMRSLFELLCVKKDPDSTRGLKELTVPNLELEDIFEGNFGSMTISSFTFGTLGDATDSADGTAGSSFIASGDMPGTVVTSSSTDLYVWVFLSEANLHFDVSS